MAKNGPKHKRAKKVGAYLTDDRKRKAGGLIYTFCAARERDAQLGKIGPASSVRRIDPETGEVIEVLALREIAARQKARKPLGGKKLAKSRWLKR